MESSRVCSARAVIGSATRWGQVQVDVVSLCAPWLVHDKLDVIVGSGALKNLL